MKKYIFAAVAALLGGMAAYAAELSSFIVNKTDGAQIEFKFATDPEMTFDGDDLVITDSASATVRYPMAEVENVTFSKYTTSLQDIVDTDKVSVEVTRSFVRISGLVAGADVRLLDINGMTLAAGRADADGSLTLGVQDLAKGVYIIAMPGHSFKFIR